MLPKNQLHKITQCRDIQERFSLFEQEADEVRRQDRVGIKRRFKDFYNSTLNVGVGFQEAYGSILSGDYFELFSLPGNRHLLIFADVSGHGLPAYTTIVKLRCAAQLTINNINNETKESTNEEIARRITHSFTDLLDLSFSKDFASLIFTFINLEESAFRLSFYSRGMHFPFVIHRSVIKETQVTNLNLHHPGWNPRKNSLLGAEIRELTGCDHYYRFLHCEYLLCQGDSILYFTDGLTEAPSVTDSKKLFGFQRIVDTIIECAHREPQKVVDTIFDRIYTYIGSRDNQTDDMTALLIDFPMVD
jgi:serine phosphatase RsbU (regulator of sigma subunit)